MTLGTRPWHPRPLQASMVVQDLQGLQDLGLVREPVTASNVTCRPNGVRACVTMQPTVRLEPPRDQGAGSSGARAPPLELHEASGC